MSCSASFISPVVLVCWITTMDEIRFNHYLPYSDNDSYDVVLNIQLPPASIERITISIMSDDTNFYQGWESQEEMQPSAFDDGSQDTGTTQIFNSLQKVANRRAIDDVREIKRKIRNGKYILLDRESLNDRAEAWAGRDIPNDYFKDDPNISYPALINEYVSAYQRGFDEETQPLAESIIEIKDDEEKQLRTTLSEYRPLVQNRSQRDTRDLVLICILKSYYRDCLDDLNIINVLSERHALIDKYEKFVRDSEEKHGESWPDPDSFRFTR